MSSTPNRPSRTRRIGSAAVAALILTSVAGGLAVTETSAAQAATAPVTASCTMPAGSGLATYGANGTANGTLDVLDSLAQVLPAHHIAGASRATVCAPRNAYASFQIELSASQGVALTNVRMTASDLTQAGGAKIPGSAAGAASGIALSREDYTTLTRLSDGELDPAASSFDTVTPAASRVARDESNGTCTDTADGCRFPDALVPDRDAVYGEARNAFNQMSVPAGQNRVVWADIFVPATAIAGTYTGTVTVTQSGGAASAIPVQLQVVSATLPATSSVSSAYFYNPSGQSAAMYQAYAELGLDNRISIVPQGQISTTASVVSSTMTPLMTGTDARVKLQDSNGLHASLTDFPMNATTDSGYFSTYKSLFTASVKTKPWAYCDEWGYQYCADAYAASAAKQWPGLPLLAIDAAMPNGAFDPNHKWDDPKVSVIPSALSGIIGGVVDVIQYVAPTYNGWKPTQYTGLEDRSPYLRAWVAGAPTSRQAWAYSSNMSGTGGSGYSTIQPYTGFPSYGIDQVASEQRAMGWQLFIDGLNGELYYSVNENPQIATDPNDNHNSYLGLNGDGTLFYPWNAVQAGGTDPIPLESIRLKRIRDGRQDYEMLKLATAQGLRLADGRTAASIAAAIFPSVSRSAVTPVAFDNAEQDLIRLFPLPGGGTSTNPVVGSHDLDCNGTPDFIGVQAGSGNLLFYPRTASDWAPNAPVVVGSGYAGTFTRLLLPGDVNGDGSPDLLGRKADGSLWLMAGNCTGSFGAAKATGSTATAPTAVGDFTGDTRPDLLDQHADGTLWLLAGNGTGFATATQAGNGWAGLTLAGVQDANRDGAVDVLARTSDGTSLLYEGTGTGGWKTVNGGVPVATKLALASYPTVIGAGDLTGDGNPDVVAVDPAGVMWRFAGDGAGGFAATGVQIGAGWASTSIAAIAL